MFDDARPADAYPDPASHTLAVDFGFYISRTYAAAAEGDQSSGQSEPTDTADGGADDYSDTSVQKYSRADFERDVYMPGIYDDLVGMLEYKGNLILEGAPGTGKTFAAKRLAYAMMGEKDTSRIQFVQFHQNYSYEDFVMGYRPTASGGFELRAGVFYGFCKKAAEHPELPYFFIIDEINRGNLSKVLGELFMAIEKDHRDEPVTLAYNGEQFAVPSNLYIIGMMNTADRSIAMIDYALRRRFCFFDMKPAFDTAGFQALMSELGDPESLAAVVDAVVALNHVIADDPSLGSGFCIGHSYFSSLRRGDDLPRALYRIVHYELIPTLKEYWFDDAATCAAETDKLLESLGE